MTGRLARTLAAKDRWLHRPPALPHVLDLQDPAFWRDPHPSFRRLREMRGPVIPLAGGGWAALSHEAVRAVLGDPARFAADRPLDAILAGADGPVHARSRRAVASLLTPPRIDAAIAQAQSAVEALLPDAPRPVDVVADLADPFTAHLDAALLSIPAATLQGLCAAHDAGGLLEQAGRVADRSPAPESLLDALGEAPETAGAVLSTLLMAAVITTRQTLPRLVLLLVANPDLQAQVRVASGCLEPMVDETLRLHPPEGLLPRRVVATTILCGTELAAGDMVMACLAAANRDPSVFASADDVVLERPPGHLAFGAGPHRCPGARLARLSLAAGARTLLAAYPRIEAAEDLDKLRWIECVQGRRLERLLVRGA